MNKQSSKLIVELSPIELSNKLANMRYDSLSEVLDLLAERLEYDAEREEKRERGWSASKIKEIARGLAIAAISLRRTHKLQATCLCDENTGTTCAWHHYGNTP